MSSKLQRSCEVMLGLQRSPSVITAPVWLFLLALLRPWRSTCLVEQQLRETEVGTHSSSLASVCLGLICSVRRPCGRVWGDCPGCGLLRPQSLEAEGPRYHHCKPLLVYTTECPWFCHL